MTPPLRIFGIGCLGLAALLPAHAATHDAPAKSAATHDAPARSRVSAASPVFVKVGTPYRVKQTARRSRALRRQGSKCAPRPNASLF